MVAPKVVLPIQVWYLCPQWRVQRIMQLHVGGAMSKRAWLSLAAVWLSGVVVTLTVLNVVYAR